MEEGRRHIIMSSKKNIRETELQEGKVITKYDRKMQKRKEQEQKDKRDKKVATVIGIAAGILAYILV
jgi:hypothetical protein